MSTLDLLPRLGFPPHSVQRRPRRGAQRRLVAGRIARLLLPASRAVEGFVSSEVSVRLSGGRWAWPDVALACREPPADGRLERPPELVVLLPAGPAGVAVDTWLVAGAAAVWCLGNDTVVEHSRSGGSRRRPAGEWAEVPGLPEVSLPVAKLLEAAARYGT